MGEVNMGVFFIIYMVKGPKNNILEKKFLKFRLKFWDIQNIKTFIVYFRGP